MKTQTFADQSFQFYFHDVNTLLLVEHRDYKITIRATGDTFSDQRKICFIHYLASEGFLPEYYQRLSNLDPVWSNLYWRVDYSRPKPRRTTNFNTGKVILGLLASAIVFWMGLMPAVFQHSI